MPYLSDFLGLQESTTLGNSGGMQGKVGSHMPYGLSLHLTLKGGSESHVSVEKHRGGGRGHCMQKRKWGGF